MEVASGGGGSHVRRAMSTATDGHWVCLNIWKVLGEEIARSGQQYPGLGSGRGLGPGNRLLIGPGRGAGSSALFQPPRRP